MAKKKSLNEAEKYFIRSKVELPIEELVNATNVEESVIKDYIATLPAKNNSVVESAKIKSQIDGRTIGVQLTQQLSDVSAPKEQKDPPHVYRRKG